MKKGFSITCACAIGSGIGMMLAINFGMFWLIGLLIGGLTGYVIYDFKSVIKAVPVAWNYAAGQLTTTNWKMVGSRTLIIIGSIIAIAGYPLLFLNLPHETGNLDAFFFLTSIFAMVVNCSLIGFSIVGKSAEDIPKELLDEWGLSFLAISAYRFYPLLILILILSPIVSIYGMVIGLYKFLNFFLDIIIFWLKFTRRFFWKLFMLIHSDIRLLVGIDSIIGGAVGYYFENMIIGMLAGAVWGFINYWLVSIKWLKLQPKH
ncbi:MAG: hypothetical protein K8F24_05655 [Bacteroidales bacterium]|nr:hypothetical protein [Bacteroidales bacterium]